MTACIAVTIAAEGDGLAAPMDGRFGRAPRFLLVQDSDGSSLETIDNTAAAAEHGAGPGAAAIMHEHQVAAVISGRYGPQAFQALKAFGIETWIAPAGLTAEQALARYQEGQLSCQQLRVFR